MEKAPLLTIDFAKMNSYGVVELKIGRNNSDKIHNLVSAEYFLKE